jgi:N-acetylmuramic acid 6-phosphate etherase
MVAVTGPEFITGSTRLNAGTATKLILNLITTTAMVQLGHVRGSKMIDMQLSNLKLVERGVRMISEATGCSATAARAALDSAGNVRDAIDQLSGHAHT